MIRPLSQPFRLIIFSLENSPGDSPLIYSLPSSSTPTKHCRQAASVSQFPSPKGPRRRKEFIKRKSTYDFNIIQKFFDKPCKDGYHGDNSFEGESPRGKTKLLCQSNNLNLLLFQIKKANILPAQQQPNPLHPSLQTSGFGKLEFPTLNTEDESYLPPLDNALGACWLVLSSAAIPKSTIFTC